MKFVIIVDKHFKADVCNTVLLIKYISLFKVSQSIYNSYNSISYKHQLLQISSSLLQTESDKAHVSLRNPCLVGDDDVIKKRVELNTLLFAKATHRRWCVSMRMKSSSLIMKALFLVFVLLVCSGSSQQTDNNEPQANEGDERTADNFSTACAGLSEDELFDCEQQQLLQPPIIPEDKTGQALYKSKVEPVSAWVQRMALETQSAEGIQKIKIQRKYLNKIFNSLQGIQQTRKMGKIMSGPLPWDKIRNLKFASFKYGFPIHYSPLNDFLPSIEDPDHEFWLQTLDESMQECGNDDACTWTKFKTAHIMKQLLAAALNQPYDMDYEKLVFIVLVSYFVYVERIWRRWTTIIKMI